MVLEQISADLTLTVLLVLQEALCQLSHIAGTAAGHAIEHTCMTGMNQPKSQSRVR